jgi:hypothetical protein
MLGSAKKEGKWGGDKLNGVCSVDTRTTDDHTNLNQIGVTCCNALTGTGAGRPGCMKNLNFADAEAYCAANGKVLCSKDQISGGAGVGTGCGFDTYHVWTRDACTEDALSVWGECQRSEQCKLRFDALSNTNPGCYALKTRDACMGSKDGRSKWSDSACHWCCGSACATNNANKCQPKGWLLSQPANNAYVGFSEGFDYDTCPTAYPTAAPTASPTLTAADCADNEYFTAHAVGSTASCTLCGDGCPYLKYGEPVKLNSDQSDASGHQGFINSDGMLAFGPDAGGIPSNQVFYFRPAPGNYHDKVVGDIIKYDDQVYLASRLAAATDPVADLTSVAMQEYYYNNNSEVYPHQKPVIFGAGSIAEQWGYGETESHNRVKKGAFFLRRPRIESARAADQACLDSITALGDDVDRHATGSDCEQSTVDSTKVYIELSTGGFVFDYDRSTNEYCGWYGCRVSTIKPLQLSRTGYTGVGHGYDTVGVLGFTHGGSDTNKRVYSVPMYAELTASVPDPTAADCADNEYFTARAVGSTASCTIEYAECSDWWYGEHCNTRFTNPKSGSCAVQANPAAVTNPLGATAYKLWMLYDWGVTWGGRGPRKQCLQLCATIPQCLGASTTSDRLSAGFECKLYFADGVDPDFSRAQWPLVPSVSGTGQMPGYETADGQYQVTGLYHDGGTGTATNPTLSVNGDNQRWCYQRVHCNAATQYMDQATWKCLPKTDSTVKYGDSIVLTTTSGALSSTSVTGHVDPTTKHLEFNAGPQTLLYFRPVPPSIRESWGAPISGQAIDGDAVFFNSWVFLSEDAPGTEDTTCGTYGCSVGNLCTQIASTECTTKTLTFGAGNTALETYEEHGPKIKGMMYLRPEPGVFPVMAWPFTNYNNVVNTTDKLTFSMVDTNGGGCGTYGCRVSQVMDHYETGVPTLRFGHGSSLTYFYANTDALSNANPGCHSLSTRDACMGSKDGRSAWSDSPCHWCCGSACTTNNANKCEPKEWLLSQPAYVGFSEGFDYNTCPTR